MSIEIVVPPLPESVSDATLVAWHKKVGDSVSRDENLADLETDKVVLELPAPANGKIVEIRVQSGATVTSGNILAILEEGDAVAASAPVVEAAVTAPVSEVKASSKDSDVKASGTDSEVKASSTDSEVKASSTDSDVKASSTDSAHKLSPAVRRLLDEHDLDATFVSGSGKDGRISKADVMAYLKSHNDENVAPGDPEPALDSAVQASGVTRRDERVAMTRLRLRIAERMVQAQQSSAMLTTFNEVDLTEVIALRNRHKDNFEKAHGVKLGFMSFFAKAAVDALKKFPVVNASIEGSDIVYHNYYDVGIAVSSERGLMVPVVRDVDQLSFAAVEESIAGLGKKARDGTMSMEDLTGGTFTITNGGIFGSMLSTPILNPPQSAILGMHAIQQRPIAVDGEVAIRPMMYLALTYDHRIIDGKEAVQFLVHIKQTLEDPGRLLLQV